MVLEGTVAERRPVRRLVDLGVHQSRLGPRRAVSHKFVDDAREVVKTGQIVKVRVLEVDLARKRISLTMKLNTPMRTAPRDSGSDRPASRVAHPRPAAAAAQAQGALAAAFAKVRITRS